MDKLFLYRRCHIVHSGQMTLPMSAQMGAFFTVQKRFSICLLMPAWVPSYHHTVRFQLHGYWPTHEPRAALFAILICQKHSVAGMVLNAASAVCCNVM